MLLAWTSALHTLGACSLKISQKILGLTISIPSLDVGQVVASAKPEKERLALYRQLCAMTQWLRYKVLLDLSLEGKGTKKQQVTVFENRRSIEVPL